MGDIVEFKPRPGRPALPPPETLVGWIEDRLSYLAAAIRLAEELGAPDEVTEALRDLRANDLIQRRHVVASGRPREVSGLDVRRERIRPEAAA